MSCANTHKHTLIDAQAFTHRTQALYSAHTHAHTIELKVSLVSLDATFHHRETQSQMKTGIK